MDSFWMHILAMFFMLLDHLGMLGLVPGGRYIGRLAFPLFCFMIAEGYHHTKDWKKYLTRILFFAFLSEIPYNLFLSGSLFYPVRQNVLWTFALALLSIRLCEKRKKCTIFIILFLNYVIGTLLMVDYYGAGVMMVLLFHFFREKKFCQFLGMACLNLYLIPSNYLPSTHIPVQAFAMCALPIIWSYNGKAGYHSKATKICFYLFYPVHFLVLYFFI